MNEGVARGSEKELITLWYIELSTFDKKIYWESMNKIDLSKMTKN